MYMAIRFTPSILLSLGALLGGAGTGHTHHRPGSTRPAATSYHVVATDSLGGSGSWDYLAFDTAGNRLFIGRQNRIMVVDPDHGRVLGEVPGLDRAHGTAFAYRDGHGFATSGHDSTVTMFDLRTLKVLRRTHAAVDDDAIIFDPATNRIFTFNGDAKSSTVIDARTGKRIATIPLGASPESGVTAGNGKVYVNLASSGEMVEIDARAMRVTKRWSMAPCKGPSGLAIDPAHERLFSGCRNKIMAISDARAGKLLTTLPIGSGNDAAAFDPGKQLAFASNGDGTVTVVHEDSPSRFRVVQTIQTLRGARTMALDPRTHRLYLATAKFGPRPAPTPARPHPWPSIVPGSFMLLVVAP